MSMPTVTIVFLVYNRREELRTSLRTMLHEVDYDRDRIDAIVVDNASSDGSSDMVREEFPQVRVIQREENIGVSAWNDGFAVATGDWVMALDDDAYLPGDGLRRALAGAEEHAADLVSFSVQSSYDPSYRYDQRYRTGLLSFWGCAVVMKREVLEVLRGYDPEIFVWANELEFMMRFFDRGYRHLHLPEVPAVHIREPGGHWSGFIRSRAYPVNSRHWAYIAAKLLHPRDAVEAFIALLVRNLRDGTRTDRAAFRAMPGVFKGFAHGLRHRDPLRRAVVSRAYRRGFESFASPWWLARPPSELARKLPGELARQALGVAPAGPPPPGRREEYFDERARLYPKSAATLDF